MALPRTVGVAPRLRMEEATFKGSDGTDLFYRAWTPARPNGTGVLVLHRGHEHSARLQHVVEALDLPGASFFAWDQRGHGKSPGPRAAADGFDVLVQDLEAFARHVERRHGIALQDMALLAQSVGAVVASAWVRKAEPPLRGQVLAVPAFRVRLYVPFALPLLRLRRRLFGNGTVRSYVKATMLTHDPEQAAAYRDDPLIFPQIPINVLVDLFDVSRRVIEDAPKVRVPTFVLVAGADRVVRKSAQRRYYERLASPVKEIKEYPGFFHAIFHEKDRHLPIQDAGAFLRRVMSRTPEAK
jgi:alpha-beta hydrolase superfamily lysophospholipase